MGKVLQKRIGAGRRFHAGEELVIALGVAAGDLGSVVEGVLREQGLNQTRWAVLRMLRGAGEHGLSHSVIAERLLMGSPDITRMVDRMEEEGLVERKRSESDRRVVLHCLTGAGRELLDRIEEPMAAVHDGVVTALGKSAVEELVAGCERVIAAVGDGSIAAPDAGRETGR